MGSKMFNRPHDLLLAERLTDGCVVRPILLPISCNSGPTIVLQRGSCQRPSASMSASRNPVIGPLPAVSHLPADQPLTHKGTPKKSTIHTKDTRCPLTCPL
jgi:hypothetical protein